MNTEHTDKDYNRKATADDAYQKTAENQNKN